jgi:hypothetical protein
MKEDCDETCCFDGQTTGKSGETSQFIYPKFNPQWKEKARFLPFLLEGSSVLREGEQGYLFYGL